MSFSRLFSLEMKFGENINMKYTHWNKQGVGLKTRSYISPFNATRKTIIKLAKRFNENPKPTKVASCNSPTSFTGMGFSSSSSVGAPILHWYCTIGIENNSNLKRKMRRKRKKSTLMDHLKLKSSTESSRVRLGRVEYLIRGVGSSIVKHHNVMNSWGIRNQSDEISWSTPNVISYMFQCQHR